MLFQHVFFDVASFVGHQLLAWCLVDLKQLLEIFLEAGLPLCLFGGVILKCQSMQAPCNVNYRESISFTQVCEEHRHFVFVSASALWIAQS